MKTFSSFGMIHPNKLRTDIDEVFDGVCKKCRNFKDKTCYSCLEMRR